MRVETMISMPRVSVRVASRDVHREYDADREGNLLISACASKARPTNRPRRDRGTGILPRVQEPTQRRDLLALRPNDVADIDIM